MDRFCVNCGKVTNSLIRGLCAECYLRKNDVLELPAEFVIDYDRRSGRVRIGRDWIELTDEVIGHMIGDKIAALAKPKKLPLSGIDVALERKDGEILASVSFSAEVEGVPLGVKKEVRVRLHKTISDASMKIASNYHEAIIQVRFLKKPTLDEGQAKLKELLGLLREQKKKIELSEAIDTKNVRGGFDVFVGSAKAAKIVSIRMAKKYGTRPIYSNKQIGMNDNGTTKYRHTYCVKFGSG